MADFQTVLDHVAQVIGGTAPDATNRPRWFSGRESADGTGLIVPVVSPPYPPFTGAYSAPPESITDVPVALVLPGNFEVGGPQNRDVYYQGEEYNVDDLRVLIFVYRIDSETDIANLMPYRDLMPAAFAAKMSAFSTASILQAMVRGGKPMNITYAGIPYSGWEFTVRVIRMVSRTYTS